MAATEAKPLWFQRSGEEFGLRCTGHSTARVLMHRYADENGLDSKGDLAVWRDIATFDNYNDAEHILRLLQGRESD